MILESGHEKTFSPNIFFVRKKKGGGGGKVRGERASGTAEQRSVDNVRVFLTRHKVKNGRRSDTIVVSPSL
jgi:hypothetical protein